MPVDWLGLSRLATGGLPWVSLYDRVFGKSPPLNFGISDNASIYLRITNPRSETIIVEGIYG